MPETLSVFNVLTAVDVALFTLFLAGFVRARHLRSLSSDPSKAFMTFESSIERVYPGLPVGHTLREALEMVKSEGVEVNWDLVFASLTGYEARRFGGVESGQQKNAEVLKLARKVNGRRKWWRP